MADSSRPQRSASNTAWVVRVRWMLLASVGLATLGMIVTISGFLVPSFLLPGTYLIGLGLLGLAVAGVVAVWQSAVAEPEPITSRNV